MNLSKTQFRGKIQLPSSKSHTMRAILLASLGRGESVLLNPLFSPDTQAMLQAIEAFGAKWQHVENGLKIFGVGRVPEKLKRSAICAGNSGQVLRFASAFYAQSRTPILVTGDDSLQQLRPCKTLVDSLKSLGAFLTSLSPMGAAPLLIQGPISSGTCSLSGIDSQPVSALLMSLSLLDGPSHIHVHDLGERPWIDLTLDWMKRLHLRFTETKDGFFLPGGDHIEPFQRVIPGDLSALAFPLVLGLITHSTISISGVDLSDIQGDKAILDVISQMGGKYSYDPKLYTITVSGPQKLKGVAIDVNPIIDALPSLAVLACFAEGTTRLYNGAIARKKESDRIHAMAHELQKMGAKVIEQPDGLEIEGVGSLNSAILETYHDHRVAMALACAAFASSGTSKLNNPEVVQKSFPNFFEQLRSIAV